ncbi:hypothetical protein [Archangium violaceum]|uniref:Uncharacterized protein n=1 Tax=Archangium violaceum Cb vi76 TaxID=1406225 RepID=A0A084SMW3_9BACT|nr:hypothetical protein [Archangium violaceum]KFA89798.1 hypothetical protein Q664_32110 [Archangium violaceum Cb vi76]
MSLDKVWLSFVDYRPDPATPEKDRIALGCILEARARRSGLFSLAGRVSLTEPELMIMDRIGRETLVHPADFLRQQLREVLDRAGGALSFEQGGALRQLSQVHRWSLYVMPPRLIRIERHLSQNNTQALYSATGQLFIARMLGRDVSLDRTLRAKQIIPEDWRAQVPPAWQIAQSSLSAPMEPRAQR